MPGTVDPGRTQVHLKDPFERLVQYVASLILWATKGPFDRIVFCENSNQGERLGVLGEMPCWSGKKFEVISFDGNEVAQRVGKGYGEGLMIRAVLLQSRLAKESEHFWKIGGRLYVDNAAPLEAAHRKTPNVMNPMDTRFHKWNRSFFEHHLLDLYERVNDWNGSIIETVWTEAVEPFRASGEVSAFSESPQYVGQEGFSGRWYREIPPGTMREAGIWASKVGVARKEGA